MRTRALILALLVMAAFAGCGKMSTITPVSVFSEHDYQWHKQTARIRVHWNYIKTQSNTIIADGYVEPFNPKYGLHNVKLDLVGLDKNGVVVNSQDGRPSDGIIVPPSKDSYFRIEMKLNGAEDKFTVRGSYYWFMVGAQPTLSSRFYDTVPLFANEPY